jgi:Flp pilus assembly secretin CpaC
VLDIRKLVSLTLPAVLLFLCVSTGHAQDTDADKAKALLDSGLKQFTAKHYEDAQKSLMEASKGRDALSEGQKKQLDDCLDKVGPALKQQLAGRDSLVAGEKALQANQLAEAQKAFEAAAVNESLTDAERKTAQEQLALVKQRQASPTAAPRGDAPAALAAGPAAPGAAAAPAAPAAEASPEAGEDSLGDLARQREVLKKKAEYDIDQAIKRGYEIHAKAASATDFDAASSAVSVAENVLTTNKGLFTPAETRQHQDDIDQLRKFIETKRAVWEREQVNQQKIEIQKANDLRVSESKDLLRREITKYTADAQVAIHQHEYQRAMDLMEKILRIDPSNEAIRNELYIVKQVQLMKLEKGYTEEEAYQRQQQMISIRESEIPWYELLRYPPDWREITARREIYNNVGGNESEQNRLAYTKLKKKEPKVDFENLEFKSVIDWLQQVSGLNINVKWTTLEQAAIQQNTPVHSVHLQDVSIEKALRTVLDDVGASSPLSYVVDEGVVTISTRDDLTGPRYRKTLVYDIRDLIVTVPSFTAPRMDLTTSMNINGQNGGTCSSGCGLFNNSGNCGANANQQNRQQVVTQITTLIATTIDKDSWMAPIGTGTVGSMSELNGQLVITQTAENHRAVLDLINQLREAKALLITVETRFLSVNSGFLSTVGLDLQTFINIGSTLGGGGFATDPVTGASVPLQGPSGWTANGYGGPSVQTVTPLGIKQNTSAFATQNLSSPISGGVASIGSSVTTPSLQVGGTFLDDIQVDFLIQATQANQMSRSLIAPRLTLFNGQRAYVTFATQQAYVSNLTPVVAENVVAYQATVNIIPSGSVLDVEATVSADRRYVVMTLQPQINQLLGFSQYFTSVVTRDANGQPSTGVGYIQLPNVASQEMSMTVSVPDGGTLFLSGQKQSGELERENGAPLLDKIPIINRLFKNEGKVRDEQTTVILVKPKIIIHREEEERQFP